MPHGKRRTIKIPRKTPKPPQVSLMIGGIRPPPPMEEQDESEFENFDNLRKDYKHRREQFCREYIKDFNGAQALRRMGSKNQTPWVKASQWLGEPYTQYYLGTLINKLDDKAIVTRSEILLGLKREAHYYGMDGSAGARISAFRAMAKILGLEITKLEGNLSVQGGVMTIPLAGTPEEWEKSAKMAQEKLKVAVRK